MLPDEHACNACGDIICCWGATIKFKFRLFYGATTKFKFCLFYGQFGAKLPNLKTTNISCLMVLKYCRFEFHRYVVRKTGPIAISCVIFTTIQVIFLLFFLHQVTLLQRANEQGLKDIVKYFADNVADINIQDDDDLVSILCVLHI